jgi:hypothetical protein
VYCPWKIDLFLLDKAIIFGDTESTELQEFLSQLRPLTRSNCIQYALDRILHYYNTNKVTPDFFVTRLGETFVTSKFIIKEACEFLTRNSCET